MCQMLNCLFQATGTWNLCRGARQALIPLRGRLWLWFLWMKIQSEWSIVRQLTNATAGNQVFRLQGTAPSASPPYPHHKLLPNYCKELMNSIQPLKNNWRQLALDVIILVSEERRWRWHREKEGERVGWRRGGEKGERRQKGEEQEEGREGRGTKEKKREK